MSNSSQNGNAEPIRPFLFGVAGIAIAVAIYAYILMHSIIEWDQRGQFGDMFGALNAAFSGLAFAALAYTLHLQRKELVLQRLELAQTRAELAKQAESQARQADTALRAAEISAVGALFQSYCQLAGNAQYHLISDGDWRKEIKNVRSKLRTLLKEQSFATQAERDA